ncbi:ATP-binding cassette domain-containing protein [Microbacterium proteolyticum]|uniref:ABC transporter ATP-binding protein n=1 Tax=Microbacterium proteolyticum TaxID=1572644 RepID=UPI00345B8258
MVDPGPPPPLPADLVVPPRPPLPPVGGSPSVADPTPADVAVEEPKVVDELPVDESAVVEEPADDSAVVEERVAVAEPVDAEPVAVEAPVDAEPAGGEDPTVEASFSPVLIPSDENTTPVEAVVEEPVAVEDPAADVPAADEPAVVGETADPAEPVSEELVTVAEPVSVETPAEASPAAAEEAAVEESVVEETVVDEPVLVDEPAAEEPAMEQSAAEEPAAAEPLTVDESAESDSAVPESEIADESVPEESASDPAVEESPSTDQDTDSVDADADAAVTGSADTQDASAAEVAGAAAAPAAADESDVASDVPALRLRNVTKLFGEVRAVDGVDLTVPAGSFYGLVGPNGAGKTTTLSIIAGLLRSNGGTVEINGVDAGRQSRAAKKLIGVLPDRLRTFDRLTGRQLLSYYGALRGLPSPVVESRAADLARAFDLVEALGRPVSDYSAGMTKKVMLAGAMIHSPRLLVLDEPFEAVDPVSSAVILDILRAYVDHGGTVILSSHGMELVERVCSRVAVIVSGQVLAEGTVDEVRGESTLEQRFLELSGGLGDVEGLEWLHTFSA